MRLPAGTRCAHQWHKNGDHPDDAVTEDAYALYDEKGEVVNDITIRSEGRVVRHFRHPDFEGSDTCLLCERTWDDHGWIDLLNWTVCPGDWVYNHPGGGLAVRHPTMSEDSDRYQIRYCCRDCTASGEGLGTTHVVEGSHRVSVFEVAL